MRTATREAHGATRLMYPDTPDPLTPADLHRRFTTNYAERQWRTRHKEEFYARLG